MRPAKFEYFAPKTLSEAAQLLSQSDGMGRVLAGGQSLMPAINLRLARPTMLIDIHGIADLSGITVATDAIRIGPMTRHREIIDSAKLAEVLPVMRVAGLWIAHSTIREHGTIGGSLALADPAAEWATTLTLLGGRVRAFSVRGERWIPIEEFFVSYYTTALAEDEILTEIEIPLPERGTTYGFDEFSRQHGAFALAMIGVALGTGADANVQHARAVIGGCGPCPLTVDMSALVGRKADDAMLDLIFKDSPIQPGTDIHATAGDRTDIARSLFRRCVLQTYTKSRGH